MQDMPENQNSPTPVPTSDEPTLPSQAVPPEPPTESSTHPQAGSTGPRVSRVVVRSSVIGAIVIAGLVATLLLRPTLGGGTTQSANTQNQPTATTDIPSATTTFPAAVTPTSPAAPTATSVPGTATSLVSDKNVTEACSAGLWPASITVGNTGATPLQWSATAPQGVTLTPSAGTLPAGSQNSPSLQQIQLSGTYSQSEFSIAFTSTGGTESVKVTCI
jgi:hypothetical protein